jgi:hypothetical protein
MKKVLSVLFFCFVTCSVSAQESDIKSIVHLLTGEKIYCMRDGVEKWAKVVTVNGHDYIATIVVDRKIEHANGGSEQELSFLLIDKSNNKIVLKKPCVYPDLKKWIFTARLKNDNSDQLILWTSTGSMFQYWRIFDFEGENFIEVGGIQGTDFEIEKSHQKKDVFIEAFDNEASPDITVKFYKIENEEIVDCGDEFSDSEKWIKSAEYYKRRLAENPTDMNVVIAIEINKMIVFSYIKAKQMELAQKYANQARKSFWQYQAGKLNPVFVECYIENFDKFLEENGLSVH